jgi:hypothetical protein
MSPNAIYSDAHSRFPSRLSNFANLFFESRNTAQYNTFTPEIPYAPRLFRLDLARQYVLGLGAWRLYLFSFLSRFL